MAGKRQTVLVVLDGWGYREQTDHNAISAAKKPVFDELWSSCPHSLLDASGPAVGLPEGQMGNSEVGHTTIGAGTVVDTDLVRIGKSIQAGDFERNEAINEVLEHVRSREATLHLMGIIGDGGVHGHGDHLLALLKAAKAKGLVRVAVHAFADGRDTLPQSAAGYLRELEGKLADIGIGFIASVTGRYYAMDRDKNWERTSLAEKAIFEGEGRQGNGLPSEFVASLYAAGELDEHLEPIVFSGPEGGAKLKDGDAVFFWNYRADRARQLSIRTADRIKGRDVAFATLTSYGAEISVPAAFPPVSIKATLAGAVSAAGLSQAHIAETEKFAHATYFLNGGREEPHAGERFIVIESRKDVKTHDEAPEMRAGEIADAAVDELRKGTDFIFINFANADMVGHTANVDAIVKAVESVDRELGRVVSAADASGASVFITADHGNAEMNIDHGTQSKHTSHTLSPVPAIVTKRGLTLRPGGLKDVAPTILGLLGVSKPEAMTGESLLS